MGLDRDDLAARNMVAAIRTLDAEVRVPPTLADFAVECADALIARLRPATVAQVADTPEPRRTVGAVVRWNNDSREYVIVSPDGCRAVRNDMGAALFTLRDTDTFVRWATREECERHGLSWVERGAAPPAAGLDAPAFDEASERETAVDIAKDRGLDVAEEVGFVAGWLARARIAAKGGVA